jgi:hypothetical protein
MPLLRRGSAVLLTTLLLAACGSNDSADDEAKTFVVDKKDIQFELPEDYDEFDADDLAGKKLDEVMQEEFADNLGEEGAAQMAQLASQAELFAFDDEAVDGFLANVNVLIPGELDELPTESQVELEFRSIGAEVTGTEEVETALGDALLVEYDLKAQGRTIQGTGLLLIVDGELVNITASSLDAEESREIADLIVDSLEKTD